ncbi:MAG: hypothetical protein VX768_17090 [Planctomycetota bacterium]|nr:hypothetical protein [Planctomycetota bacterium]
MKKHTSFVPSDFSASETPLLLFLLAGILLLPAGVAVLLLVLPAFWALVFALVGIGCLWWVCSRKNTRKVRASTETDPSLHVPTLCDDRTVTLARAVKAYCDDTGFTIQQGKDAVEFYRNNGFWESSFRRKGFTGGVKPGPG